MNPSKCVMPGIFVFYFRIRKYVLMNYADIVFTGVIVVLHGYMLIRRVVLFIYQNCSYDVGICRVTRNRCSAKAMKVNLYKQTLN